MIYLILSIASTTALFILFRILPLYRIHTFNTIVINYLAAALFGWLITKRSSIFSGPPEWLFISVIIGILFIVMFHVIGKSTQKTGISVTTIASKMSVVIPIAFSLIYDPSDTLSTLKIWGIVTAILAIFLTVYRKQKLEFDPAAIYLPVLLFVGLGFVDSLVKFAQHTYITDANLTEFASSIFLVSFLCGILVKLLFATGKFTAMFQRKTLLAGSLLGICNFGSIYFFVRSLNLKKGAIDSSAVFGVNNLGVVSLSVLLGLFLFREKLTSLNWVGVALSLLAIIMLAYA